MKIETNGEITTVGENGDVRIERGPKLLTATATEELLHDDNTHAKYWAGERKVGTKIVNGEEVDDIRVGRDSLGKEIVIGEPMTYLAWATNVNDQLNAWYVYKNTPLTEAEIAAYHEGNHPDKPEPDTHRWVEQGMWDSRDEALVHAFELAGA